MTDTTPQPGSWNIVLRRISEPTELKALTGKSIGVIVVSALFAVAGLALAISGISWSGWILAVLGLLSVGIWVLMAVNNRVASTWTGDDLIEILVADEGVIGQGGTAIAWNEISEIYYEWSKPVVSGNLTSQLGGGIAAAGFKAAGIDTETKAFKVRLKDFKAVKARTTSKVQRLALFEPMLGDPGYLHVGQHGRSAEAVQELIAVLNEQTTRHGIPLTRREQG